MIRRWARAFLLAVSESPPDRELAGDQSDAVLTLDALRDWALKVRDAQDALPQEYRPGMRKAAADVLRILDAG